MTWRSTVARSWQRAGTDPTHLLRVSVYLSDIRTAEHMYKAWNKYFEDLHLVGRSKLRPVETRVTRAWFQRLKLNYHAPLSIFAFNFNLRHYNLDEDNRPVRITHEARLKKEVFRVEVRPRRHCPPCHPPHFRASFLAFLFLCLITFIEPQALHMVSLTNPLLASNGIA
jgi:enamine deaminase RidA (YjgF/YER057c/UK114 family)